MDILSVGWAVTKGAFTYYVITPESGERGGEGVGAAVDDEMMTRGGGGGGDRLVMTSAWYYFTK